LAPAQEYANPLSSLKASGKATLAESKDGKRKLLAAQMREKAAIKFNKKNEMAVKATASTQQVDAPPLAKPVDPSGKLASTSDRTPAEPKSGKTTSTPASTTSQQSVLSPLDTYEMSDREQSESDSDSENETRKDKKRVPSWAQKPNLIPALEKQYTATSSKFDPDEIFGEVQTCDLQAIFDQKKARYQRRTSSGNWNQDRATAAEKLTYKRKLGFTAKA
jgi:activator of HSP90 ATPase